MTGSSGEYYFRTIKPVPYPGRTPHIHFKIKQKGKELLVTQCYIKGHPGNEKDGIWRSVRDEKQRAAITIPFEKIKESKIGEHAAKFDIVLGQTPEAG
jgi:protocatechuate 3,4-dioxygenase beta subunit